MNIMGRPAAADGSNRPRLRFGLSGKLLLLTLLFVMIAEVLIYVPSVANFRLNWLQDRLSAAYTAALVFETAPMLSRICRATGSGTSPLGAVSNTSAAV